MIRRWMVFYRDEAGATAVTLGVSLLTILAIAAIVIDLGRAYVVNREMQNAAEAGAVNGATFLFQKNTTPPDPNWTPGPNWAAAATKAALAVRQNYVDGVNLSDFSQTNVQVGYWDTTWTSSTAPANLNGSADPAHYTPVTATEVPAVKVTLTKNQDGTGTGAPLSTYLASVMGINTLNMQSSAVAVRASPTGISAGDAFPMAMPENYVTSNYNSTITITPSNGDGNWTTFTIDSNSVPTIRDLIDTGNPTSLHIGDPLNSSDTGGWIWIEPGLRSTLFDYAATRKGQTMMMCVVGSDVGDHVWTPIKNFVAFNIEDAGGSGTNSYITGHFVPGYTIDSGTGATNHGLGTYNPAKIVQ